MYSHSMLSNSSCCDVFNLFVLRRMVDNIYILCFKLAMFLSSQKHIVASLILEQKHYNVIMIWNVLLIKRFSNL